MIDTVQVSRTLLRPPDFCELEKIGWSPLFHRQTGEITSFCFNGDKGEHKPRLTISPHKKDYWIIRAEVSPGSWLFGSNLHLVNESEKEYFLDCLSDYVETYSGLPFDAHLERVTRVDFTRDFYVGENNILPILAEFAKLDLPKYNLPTFYRTTVAFRNAGKQLTKEYKIYSKYHERLDKGTDPTEQEKARGILRLEESLRKSGVYRLAKSLRLKSHHANHILTQEVSDMVIERAMKVLAFDKILNRETGNFKNLFQNKSYNDGAKYLTFLFLKNKYGSDYSKFEPFGINKRTCQRYWKECCERGVLSLE